MLESEQLEVHDLDVLDLTFNGAVLRGGDTLATHRVRHGSVLVLVKVMHVKVETEEGVKVCVVDAYDTETVASIKAKIRAQYSEVCKVSNAELGSPSVELAVDQMALYFGDDFLDAGRALTDYGIVNGDTITLVMMT